MNEHYVLDLAFDADESREFQARLFPLQGGLVQVTDPTTTTTAEGTSQWHTKFKSGDQLSFRVLDTSLATQNSMLLYFWAAFFQKQSPASLANDVHNGANPLIYTGLDLHKVPSIISSVYNNPRTGWTLGEATPLGASLTFSPSSQLTRYVLQARVEIMTGLGELRSYVFDPEVYIDGSGGS